MSETFEKVLVKGDRLGCITSKAKFQVLKGAQNITCQPFQSRLPKTSLACVQPYSSKFKNYYKQRGAVAVDSRPQDFPPRKGSCSVRCQLRCR